MSVPVQSPVTNHIGNGVTTVFPYEFLLLESADLKVIVDGVTKTIGLDYTVSGLSVQAGGDVTFILPPVNAAKITLVRNVALRRTIDYQYAGDFDAATVNRDIDRVVMMIQDSGLAVANALRFPSGDEADGLLPDAATRALKTLAFDAFGNPFISQASGTADGLAAALVSAGGSTTGAGIVGYNPATAYGASTVGAQLKAIAADFLTVPITVASVAALRLRSKLVNTRVQTMGYYAVGDGGGNLYYYDAADTTTADNGGSTIVAADGGRWKTVERYTFSPLQWGAKGDNTQDDRPFLQAAIDYLSALNVPIAGTNAGAIICRDERRIYKLAAGNGLNMNVPITFHLAGMLNYTQATGTALRIGTSLAWNNGYDIYVRAIIGLGGATPTSVNLSGSRGVLITSMTFSRMKIGTIYGFSLAGIDFQAYGDFGYKQVIQHNNFDLGQIVNNGYGLRMKSLAAATSSSQANLIAIQNIYGCAGCILIDDATTTASNSNTFRINSMDNVSPASAPGICLDLYGSLNDFWIGFTGTPGNSLTLRSNSYGNTIRFGNTPETDVIITYGGTNNRVITAPPTQAQLPSTGLAAPASGANVQNTTGVPVTVYMIVSTDSTGAFQVFAGPDAAAGGLKLIYTFAAGGSSRTIPLSFRVPAGGYWKVFTTANSVSYSSYAVQDAS